MKHSAKFLQAFLILGLISLFGCGGGGSGASSGGGAPSGGTIKGKVTSPSGVSFKPDSAGRQAGVAGAVDVPGAVCALEGTDRSAKTDQNGLFEITDVAAGHYLLICKKSDVNGKVYAFLKAVESRTTRRSTSARWRSSRPAASREKRPSPARPIIPASSSSFPARHSRPGPKRPAPI